jgi:transposase
MMEGKAMAEEWMNDARKIPDEVMSYLRKIAVRAIEEKEYSPEVIADVFGITRTSVYDWLRRYRADGYRVLDTRQSPGAPCLITGEMDSWLIATVCKHMPVDYGYDTVLWTREILAELFKEEFGITVGDSTVSLHLKDLGLSYQKPWFRAKEQDPREVDHFLHETFPRIQRLAEKIGADIAFEDEAGIGLQTHSGKTWGEVGKAPEVPVTGKRGGYNMLSTVTAVGALRFSIQNGKIDSDAYIGFLKQLLRGRANPLVLIADRASFHRSRKVRDFVRSHRDQIRVYFLPRYSPEMNPDEQVWNSIKSKQIGRKSIKTKSELKKKVHAALCSLQHKTEKVKSFFKLPYTRYSVLECTDKY